MKQKLLLILFTFFTIYITIAQVANPPGNFFVCDDDGDGISEFDFDTNKSPQIYGSQSVMDFTLTYHTSQADADNGTNPIANSGNYSNISNPQSIYARLVENSSGNFDTTSFLIGVFLPPSIDPSYDNALEQCDDLDANGMAMNDGFTTFDLTLEDIEIIGNNTSWTVGYYETSTDAQSDINEITNPTAYSNISAGQQTLYVRVTDTNTGCVSFTTVILTVLPNPTPGNPFDLELCDETNSGDLIESFDLTQNEAIIINGEANVFLSFYGNQPDAFSGTNAIANPTAFNNTNSPETIYARIESTITSCYSLVSFDLIVNPLPVINTPSNLEVCDDDNDGFSQFNLTNADAEITNGQSGLVVNYYETVGDAQNNVNALSSPYTNISPNFQTVYVRVEDASSSGNCASFVELQLVVNPSPEVTLDSEYDLCIGESLILDSGININSSSFNFDWQLNGITITGEDGPTLTVTTGGMYGVNVFDVISSCNSGYVLTTVNEVTCVDSDSDGVNDAEEDLNNNGNLDDDDTDMDSIPNYLDTDDDGDNVPTLVEINIPSGKMMSHPYVDTDMDLIENYLDDDDDGDLILTINEDYNNNGDPTDDDTDMSGTPDYLEANVALSVNEFTIENTFSLYPNPANDKFIIKLNNALSVITAVEIFDVQGKLIILENIDDTQQELEINVSNLHSGLYFVKLKNTAGELIRKLIIE